MFTFEFKRDQIVHREEQVGVDVRPALDPRVERTKLGDYASWLTETWPELYESTVQGPGEFLITKRFIFPGKGELQALTLNLTPRGPVFVFPRLIGPLQEETQLPTAQEVVIRALREFRKRWPPATCKVVRVGLITECVFRFADADPVKFLAEKFTRLPAPPEDGELRVRVNYPREGYNRILDLSVVQTYALRESGVPQGLGPALQVRADLNNSDQTADLTENRIGAILRRGSEFADKDVFQFLNTGRLEESGA